MAMKIWTSNLRKKKKKSGKNFDLSSGLNSPANCVKGIVSDGPFQTSLFYKPPIFCLHIQRELYCTKLPIQRLSRKRHIFGKRDNSLLLGINYCQQYLNQASISNSKSLKSWVSEVLMYFVHLGQNTFFTLSFKWFYVFYWKRNIALSLNLRKFPHKEKQCTGPIEWNLMKTSFSVKFMQIFEKKL